MTSTSKNARVAGFLYLLLTIAAPIRLIYIPTKLFVRGNAAATASSASGGNVGFLVSAHARDSITDSHPGQAPLSSLARWPEIALTDRETLPRPAARSGHFFAIGDG